MIKRKAIYYVISILVAVALMESAAYVAIAVSKPLFSEPIRRTADIYREQSDLARRWLRMGDRGRDVVDSELGWRYRAGFQSDSNAINTQGLRSRRDYAPFPPDGVTRVAAFGDSFVFGNEVPDDDAWATVVENSFDGLEVLNYGVGGYGLDQALLRYRLEGADLHPDIVLIGFIADDIRRVTNVYQRFASTNAGIFTKPRFQLRPDGSMEVLPTPIRTLDDWRPVLENPKAIVKWGEHDQWYQPLVYEDPLYDLSATVRLSSAIWDRLNNRYFDADRLFIGDLYNERAEGYVLQMAIFERFVEEVRASGAHPVILILPSSRELSAAYGGREAPYDHMLQELRSKGMEYWDATDAFTSLQDAANMHYWFAPGGHYSPLGNRIVAAWLGPLLLELGDRLDD